MSCHILIPFVIVPSALLHELYFVILCLLEQTLLKVKLCCFEQALEVTVWRDGNEYRQSYSRGKPLTSVTCQPLPIDSSTQKGTRIRFWPDRDGAFFFMPFPDRNLEN